ncbi:MULTISPECIES: hypothetical protein [unclassified Streptomyces]
MLRSTLATVIFSTVAFGGLIGAGLGVAGTQALSPVDSGWDSVQAGRLDSGWDSSPMRTDGSVPVAGGREA